MPRSSISRSRLARSGTAALAVAALALGVSACSGPPAEQDADRHISIAVDYLQLGTWDPAQNMGHINDTIVFQSVLTPLFHVSPSGEPVPYLGTSYEVSDDRKSIDIELRDDVTFADGTHMDAEGVATYFNHLVETSTFVFSPNSQKFGITFEATGDYSLRLNATSPLFHPDYVYYDIARLLLQTAVLSPAAIDDPERAKTEPMGVGPYIIEEFVPDVSLTVVRNPDFWDPEAYPFDSIEFILLEDSVAKLNALKSGQVDAARMTTEQVVEAESSGFRITSSNPTINTLIIRNPPESVVEPLRDVRVRQAMAMSFDREAIAETLDIGYGRATSQIFIEGQAQYVEGGDDRYPYDLEEARALMADAGYADGFDLVIPSFAPALEPIIQQSLADIGIRVTFEQLVDGGAWFLEATSGDSPVTIYQGMSIYNGMRLLDEQFAPGPFFQVDAELTDLLATARFGESAESAEASRELGEKVLEDVWYIPVSSPALLWASGPEVDVQLNDVLNPLLFDFQLTED